VKVGSGSVKGVGVDTALMENRPELAGLSRVTSTIWINPGSAQPNNRKASAIKSASALAKASGLEMNSCRRRLRGIASSP
jgi:hypothetical protein